MADEPVPAELAQMFGGNFTPTKFGWSWLKGDGPQGRVHVLVVETTVGRLGLVLAEDDLATFIRMAQEQLTGLVLPRPGEVQL